MAHLQELKKKFDLAAQYPLLLKQREELYERICSLKQEGQPSHEFELDLRKLDAELDLLEEHLSDPQQIKCDLIEELKKQFPKTHQELENKQNAYQKLSELKQRITPFYNALIQGADLPKKRGIFSLLFGKNSKVLLAQAIYEATLEGDKIRHHLGDEAMENVLAEFLAEARKAWNRKLYNGYYHILFQKFARYMDRLDRELSQIREELAKIEQQLNYF